MSAAAARAAPHVVAITGANSYSGRYITSLLLDNTNVKEIRNLTNHPARGFHFPQQNLETPRWPYTTQPQKHSDNVEPRQQNRLSDILAEKGLSKSYPLVFDGGGGNGKDASSTLSGRFEAEDSLRASLDGVDVLFLTYWMRYFEQKNVENPALVRIKKIVDAALDVGVKRIVYVSHTKPSTSSTIPYIKAKADAESYIQEACRKKSSSSTYAFIRPNCLFGDTPNESIVVNNTCYMFRRLPVLIFPTGSSTSFFQPVHVRDLAEMAVSMGLERGEECGFVNAVGPERFQFPDFVSTLQKAVAGGASTSSSRKALTYFGGDGGGANNAGWLSAQTVFQMTRPMNWLLNDIFVDEAISESSPTIWLAQRRKSHQSISLGAVGLCRRGWRKIKTI